MFSFCTSSPILFPPASISLAASCSVRTCPAMPFTYSSGSNLTIRRSLSLMINSPSAVRWRTSITPARRAISADTFKYFISLIPI
nr:MAG TPA: hypothetical protein [Bacteriophage sp.]